MVAYITMIYPDTKLEERLWSEGCKFVLGLDEAGRGPLAGPVVAGGVVITKECEIIPSVRDSKKMTKKQREEDFEKIKDSVLAYGIGIVGPAEIDRVGIQKAVLKAMVTVLEVIEGKLNEKIDYIIADGPNILSIPRYKMDKIKEGDLYHYSISAGSVLAKVTRDRIMREYHKKYPEYGFNTHVGYGTKKHIEAINKFGVTKIHRKSFSPIKDLFS
jgi:ribonuclease HII